MACRASCISHRWITVVIVILKVLMIYQEQSAHLTKIRLFDDNLVCRRSVFKANTLTRQREERLPNELVRLERRMEVADIDCGRVEHDKEYISAVGKRRLKPLEDLEMSCEAINQRVKRFRNPPSSFPIAFSRVVYADYEFLEEQLAKSYSPENVFCFAIDRKMHRKLKCRFEALSSCLPNVVLSSRAWPTNSLGSYQWEAQLDCAKMLSKFDWNYLVFMQNHDVIIKTNEELRRIFTLYNGRNDIMAKPCDVYVPKQCQNMENNLGRLGLCPSGSTNCTGATMNWKRGFVQMALARKAVEFIGRLDTSRLLMELSRKISGADETFLPSLAATKELGLPGSEDIGKHRYLTRYDRWNVNGRSRECEGGEWRHNVCVFGLYHVPALSRAPQVLVNKLMPSKDYGAIACLNEVHFNRTHGLSRSLLDESVYQ